MEKEEKESLMLYGAYLGVSIISIICLSYFGSKELYGALAISPVLITFTFSLTIHYQQHSESFNSRAVKKMGESGKISKQQLITRQISSENQEKENELKSKENELASLREALFSQTRHLESHRKELENIQTELNSVSKQIKTEKLQLEEEKKQLEKEKEEFEEWKKQESFKVSLEKSISHSSMGAINQNDNTNSTLSASNIQIEYLHNLGNLEYLPQIFQASDKETYNNLISSGKVLKIHDDIITQLRAYVAIRYPQNLKLSTCSWREKIPSEVLQIIESCSQKEEIVTEDDAKQKFGKYVFYSWSGELVRVLPKPLFQQLRLSNNRYLITEIEEESLSELSIGIVGLGSGQLTALNLALEGIGGTFHLADFETLGIDSFNQISGKISELGVNKAIHVARMLVELDPYLKVHVLEKRLCKENIFQFLHHDNNAIDLIVEHCYHPDPDCLREMKYLIREHAKLSKIPVLGVRGDLCYIDIERFDLEALPLLHGLKNDYGLEVYGQKISDERLEEVTPYIRKLPTRLAASAIEMGRTIHRPPMLASNLSICIGFTVNLARKILLEMIDFSGRHVLDIDDMMREEFLFDFSLYQPYLTSVSNEKLFETNKIKLKIPLGTCAPTANCPLSPSDIGTLISKAILAPSFQNRQPWKFTFDMNNGVLHCKRNGEVILPKLDAFRFYELFSIASAVENICLTSLFEFQCAPKLTWTQVKDVPTETICSIRFEGLSDEQIKELSKNKDKNLEAEIINRCTTRKLGIKGVLPESDITHLTHLGQSSDPDVNISFITDEARLMELGKLVGEAERLQCLSCVLRADYLQTLRFDVNVRTFDGIELNHLSPAEKQMCLVLRYDSANEFLNLINRKQKSTTAIGSFFSEWYQELITSSWGVGLIYISRKADSSYAKRSEKFFAAGRALQRIWLGATELGYSFQPLATLPMISILSGTQFEQYLTATTPPHIQELVSNFQNLFFKDQREEEGTKKDTILLFRIFKTDGHENGDKALRRPLAESLNFIKVKEQDGLEDEEEEEDEDELIEKECLVADVLYAFNSRNEREVTIGTGDKIAIFLQDNSGWWRGKNLTTGEVGWFPGNYVKLTDRIEIIREEASLFEGLSSTKEEINFKELNEEKGRRVNFSEELDVYE